MQQCSWLSKLTWEQTAQVTVLDPREVHRSYACKVYLLLSKSRQMVSVAMNQITQIPPEQQKRGLWPVPLPGSRKGRSCTLRWGPLDPQKRHPPRGAAPTAPSTGKVLGLNSISLLIHWSASGHRLQGRKKKKQAIKQIHAHLKQKLQSDL